MFVAKLDTAVTLIVVCIGRSIVAASDGSRVGCIRWSGPLVLCIVFIKDISILCATQDIRNE